MKSLFSIIANNNFSSPLMRGVSAAMAVETANEVLIEIFGAKIKDHANAVYFKNKIMSIACLNSVCAQEIKLHQKEIINKINSKLPAALVQKITCLS